MIRKILIANRGEIAVRIIRSSREMGIKTVAVYSDADRAAMHVRYADEAYHIGPSPSNQSYLLGEKIIEVAKLSGADAIHPGYGFLSENSAFADLCLRNGITFIGPSSESIQKMGDKITARKVMIAAGVPVVPGLQQKVTDPEALKEMVKGIGLPVIIKASAGGGGKGMRLVRNENDLNDSLRLAQSEAKAAFGDDTVYIEKYVESPHHIEFQIIADTHGNTIHLWERECSVQRRHQKVVEETPSTFITQEVRERMGEIAVKAAQAVNYYGAGTIEFIVDAQMNFYFLEMNTRLQVEHPITERVTGIDLVKEQIRIANGQTLSIAQEDVIQFGHAIECRIAAEDPANNFMPNPGLIRHISEPSGFGVRIDGYVYEGYEIPMYYDPMITKLITWGKTREEAIVRMKRALYEYKITGIKTNIGFLVRIMENPDFVNGGYDTHFIEKNLDELLVTTRGKKPYYLDMAIIAAFLDYNAALERRASLVEGGTAEQIARWKDYALKKNIERI